MKIGACWLQEREGEKYFSCKLDLLPVDGKFGVFKNEKKQPGTNQPDYNIVWLSNGNSGGHGKYGGKKNGYSYK